MDEDLKTYLAGMESRLETRIDSMETRIKEYVDERTHDAETHLLRAFSDFNTNLNVRMRKIEADVSNSDTASTTRLGNLENKITDLEIRLLKIEGGGNQRHATT